MDYLSFLETELKKAAEIAERYFGKAKSSIKADRSVLTEADLAVGKHLVAAVQRTYPDYNVIDEEAGVIDKSSQYTWVIDPIDGTSNFAVGVPTYGIMMGLLKGETPIAGGFIVPPTNELYVAEKGKGTTLNGNRVFVTQEDELRNCLVAYHVQRNQGDTDFTRNEAKIIGEVVLEIRELRSSGSEPIDVGYVACGKYGARLNQYGKIWDCVAPQIIVEEAGGVFTDFWGKPQDYSNPLKRTKINYTVCAAPPQLHRQLQAIIHQNDGATG